MPAVRADCPLCRGERARVFFEWHDVPVLIGALWPDRASARACATGDVELAFCPDCGFVWNRRFDPRLVEYTTNYNNSLHCSGVFQRYTEELVRHLTKTYVLHGKHIVDIGGGKGDFLSLMCEAGGNFGYGFDPSYDGPEVVKAGEGSARWFRAYYDAAVGARPPADLITSRFVFEHVPDPLAFLRTIRDGIHQPSRTVVYFEVPNVDLIVRRGSVWDVIYEHVSYFGEESLSAAFARAGFEVLDVSTGYDGQFVSIEARCAPAYLRPELATGGGPFGDLEALSRDVDAFAEGFRDRIADWRGRLTEWRRNGARVVAWGAGAKAVSFLNMTEDAGAVAAVVDINPDKQGRHVPGSGQPIVAPETLAGEAPDVVLLMNPIYREEIRSTLTGIGLAPELVAA
mgnify:CR=1 FL=1